MRTTFTPEQRRDPGIAASEAILRKCVHCGFCTATCPTYVLLGDELDSPRGRIYLIKDMLENERPATAEVARHVDRCLSCLSCMTTCPSGVDYRRLIDRARVHVEQTYRRPVADRALRAVLARLLPYPRRFAPLLALARIARPFRSLLPARFRAMLALVPQRPAGGGAAARHAAAPAGVSGARPVPGTERKRVAVLTGCVQSVIGHSINAATLRLLDRAGFDVVPVAGCCGSIVHHLGREAQGLQLARNLLQQLASLAADGDLHAVVSNASGCGTQLKDLGYLFRDEPDLAPPAAAIAAKTRDVTELLAASGLPRPTGGADAAGAAQADAVPAARSLRVAYHAACSMQHGQRLHEPPRELLREAGFDVVEIPESHLCCGSAGTYNMLQPTIAARLAARKLGNIEATGATVVAAGNLGCLTQLGTAAGGAGSPASAGIAFVHTVELLDWATGGPRPAALDT